MYYALGMQEIWHRPLDIFEATHLLERLVIGESNRSAFTAVWELSQNPASVSAPLVLFGGQGLGKTHLIIGAALEMRRIHPDLKVLYFPTEIFTPISGSASAANKVVEFSEFCSNADVVMFDDYGLIERWTTPDLTRDFAAVVDQCCASATQVVLVDDQPPQALPRTYEHLIRSIGTVQIVEVSPPNFSMRVEILKSMAGHMQLKIPEAILAYLANRFEGNVRPLAAAITILDYVTKAEGAPINRAMTERALANLP